MKPFAEATVVREEEDGVYGCAFYDGWQQGRGAFGGTVTGVLTRALTHSVGDRSRALRSLTVHCVTPAAIGAATVHTKVERVGKYVTHLTTRLLQNNELVAFGSAVFGAERKDVESYQTARMPEVPDPETIKPSMLEHPMAPAFSRNFEFRYCLSGFPFSGEDTAQSGGFIRPRTPGKLDAAMATALLDAWAPVAMVRAKPPVVTATIDFGFLFFENFDGTRDAGPDDHLVHLQSSVAGDGYSEELRSLWGPDGKLLAQCRQNLAMRPVG